MMIQNTLFVNIFVVLNGLISYFLLLFFRKQKQQKSQTFPYPPSIPIPGDFSFEIAEEFGVDLDDDLDVEDIDDL